MHAYYSLYSELLFCKSGSGHQDLVYIPQCNCRENLISEMLNFKQLCDLFTTPDKVGTKDPRQIDLK